MQKMQRHGHKTEEEMVAAGYTETAEFRKSPKAEEELVAAVYKDPIQSGPSAGLDLTSQ